MIKIIAICISALLPSYASASDSFERASSIAYEIIGAEVSAPMCQPPLPAKSRQEALVSALDSISTAGLSDPTGLTPLDFAVLADDVPSITRLAATGYALETRDIHGGTLLHGAALVGSQKALSYLLAHGADPNSTNSSGGTPLMVSVSQNRPEVTRSLLSAGASAALRTEEGATALHYALACRDLEIISALVAAGAPVDAKAEELAAKFGIKLIAHER